MRFDSDNDPYISPRFRASHWKALDLQEAPSEAWVQAAKIVEDRMSGRFLDPIEALEKHLKGRIKEFCGFAILALDCLLIEAMSQFYSGLDETPEHEAKNAFWTFFSKSKFFRDDFDSKRKSNVFYTHFRCGILHQAQTKKGSLVRYGQKAMVTPLDAKHIGKGLIIDRKRFHKALRNEFDAYLDRLRSQKSEDNKLRGNCQRKMRFVINSLVAAQENAPVDLRELG